MTFEEIKPGMVIVKKENEITEKIIIVTDKTKDKVVCIYIRVFPTFIDVNFGYPIERWIFSSSGTILNNAVDASDEERSKEFKDIINKVFATG